MKNTAREGGGSGAYKSLSRFLSTSGKKQSQQEAPAAREEAFTSTHKPITVGGQSQVAVGTTHISRLTDDQLIKEFLSGLYCLHGVSPRAPPSSVAAEFRPRVSHPNGSALQGVGWWKYEFCYGKHVHQYHEVNTDLFSIEMYLLTWYHVIWLLH